MVSKFSFYSQSLSSAVADDWAHFNSFHRTFKRLKYVQAHSQRSGLLKIFINCQFFTTFARISKARGAVLVLFLPHASLLEEYYFSIFISLSRFFLWSFIFRFKFARIAANYGSIARNVTRKAKSMSWQRLLKWFLHARSAKKSSERICRLLKLRTDSRVVIDFPSSLASSDLKMNLAIKNDI